MLRSCITYICHRIYRICHLLEWHEWNLSDISHICHPGGGPITKNDFFLQIVFKMVWTVSKCNKNCLWSNIYYIRLILSSFPFGHQCKFTCRKANFQHNALDHAASQNRKSVTGLIFWRMKIIYIVWDHIYVYMYICMYFKIMLLWQVPPFGHQSNTRVHLSKTPWTNRSPKTGKVSQNFMFPVSNWLI